MTITVTQGDCVAVLQARTGPLFDAVVCDPPYHLLSTVERFAKVPRTESTMPKSDAHARMSRGFMGQTWDGGDVAFRPETWRAVYDQMKSGAHLIAFSGTRTYHRMAVAIEDAGFEVRDQLAWIYGSGFPKSHNVEKKGGGEAWSGWGSALKPAWEPICLARKPLGEATIVANVLARGTGAINIDACRVPHDETLREGAGAIPCRHDQSVPRGRSGEASATSRYHEEGSTNFAATPGPRGGSDAGRFPANILHDGSDEVEAGFPQTSSGSRSAGEYGYLGGEILGRRPLGEMTALEGSTGSAARFFYSAKAGPLDRLGSEHPTVKPVDVMRWLVRLVTPPGGLILDPFAGSGTTGIAALAEGFDAELIDLEPDHVADIETKLAHLRGEGSRIVERHLKRKAARAKPAAGGLFD